MENNLKEVLNVKFTVGEGCMCSKIQRPDGSYACTMHIKSALNIK